MSKETGIIIIEGADAAGKTTLAQHFVDSYSAEYIHSGKTNDYWKLGHETLKKAVKLSQKKLVVLDRHWLSECAYGAVYRGVVQVAHSARCFDRLIIKHCGVYILCVPSNERAHLDKFQQMKLQRNEAFSDITMVARWYRDLVSNGSVQQGGSDYGAQFQRFGDFASRPDVVIHDWYRHPGDVSPTARLALRKMEELKKKQMPQALDPKFTNFLGHIGRAKLLFVGESPSPEAKYPWPFYCHGRPVSADYFNKVIHSFALPESHFLWTNAEDSNVGSALPTILSQIAQQNKRIPIIALGAVAAKALTDQGVNFEQVHHPQYVRRFMHSQMPQYEANLFKIIRGAL